jgi:threonine dehydrogenase-like Zn-dependent dehydrogenase
LSQRTIDVRPLISARYPLDDALAAFEYAAQPAVLKVLLTVNQ